MGSIVYSRVIKVGIFILSLLLFFSCHSEEKKGSVVHFTSEKFNVVGVMTLWLQHFNDDVYSATYTQFDSANFYRSGDTLKFELFLIPNFYEDRGIFFNLNLKSKTISDLELITMDDVGPPERGKIEIKNARIVLDTTNWNNLKLYSSIKSHWNNSELTLNGEILNCIPIDQKDFNRFNWTYEE